MIIEGSFPLQAPIEKVWDYLIDLQELSACLPGVDKVEKSGDNAYTGVVTVKVGPISSTFQGSVDLVVVEPPTLLKARLQGKDRNTASLVTGEFSSELHPLAGGSTEVHYRFDLAIRGRLGQFGQAVILDTARQLTDEFVTCIRTRLEQTHDPSEPLTPKTSLGKIAFRALSSQIRLKVNQLRDKVRKPFQG